MEMVPGKYDCQRFRIILDLIPGINRTLTTNRMISSVSVMPRWTSSIIPSDVRDWASFDVSTSVLNVRRDDSDKIRQKILNVSYTEWQKMGFSKGTLYYMKKNAKAEKPFSLNKNVRERVDAWKKWESKK